MSFKTFYEKWDSSYEVSSKFFVGTLEVFKNPTPNEFRSIIKNSKYGGVRFAMIGDDLYAWDGNVIHVEFEAITKKTIDFGFSYEDYSFYKDGIGLQHKKIKNIKKFEKYLKSLKETIPVARWTFLPKILKGREIEDVIKRVFKDHYLSEDLIMETDKHIENMGKDIAKKIGVKFDYWWDDLKAFAFTDMETKSSFVAKDLKTAKEKLSRMRREFERAEKIMKKLK
jgi:hypothetical protein